MAGSIGEDVGKRILLSIAGLAILAAASYLYPLVQRSFSAVIAVGLFFLPLILSAISNARHRLALDANRLKAVYRCCSVGVVLIALVLLLNGALDWRPPTTAKTRVLNKRITNGRYFSTCHLTLISWREGRATEDIIVGTAVYAGAAVGRQVSVEVHSGRFGLAWYRKVELE